MNDLGNSQANEAEESGNPEAQPRPRGRPRGSKNTRTKLGNEFLRSLGPKAKKRLADMLAGDDADLAYKAATTVLEYTFGKPVQAKEISGPDGGPVQNEEVSRREGLSKLTDDELHLFRMLLRKADLGDDANDPGWNEAEYWRRLGSLWDQNDVIRYDFDTKSFVPGPAAPTDPDARAALLTICARKNAGKRFPHDTPRNGAVAPAGTPAAVPTPPKPATPASEPQAPAEPTAPDRGELVRFLGSPWTIVCLSGRDGGVPIYEARSGNSMSRRGTWDMMLAHVREKQNGDLGEWVLDGPSSSEFQPIRPDQGLCEPGRRTVNRRRH